MPKAAENETPAVPTAWDTWSEIRPSDGTSAVAGLADELFCTVLKGWDWQRGIRSIAEKGGKQVRFEMDGEVNSFTTAVVQAAALLGYALAKTEPLTFMELNHWTKRAMAYMKQIDAGDWMKYETCQEIAEQEGGK
ncbi:MAG: hypothetical protein ACYC3V_20420 [Chloroflexota bacterium]